MQGDTDFSLDDTEKWILLKRTGTAWEEVFRSDYVSRIPDASATLKGIVEPATGTETAAGTDTQRAITPASLAEFMQYDTIWIPAGAMTPTTTSGAEAGTNEYATNDINLDYFAFDPATEEYVEFDIVMPESWDRGPIKAKFYWAPGSSTATAGDVVEWKIQAGAISDDDAIDTALGTAQVITDTVLAGLDGDLHISGATPAITVGGSPALGDLIHFKVSRNSTSANDTMDGEDAWLFGVLIQFKKNQTVAGW